jgi:hypothetical protein
MCIQEEHGNDTIQGANIVCRSIKQLRRPDGPPTDEEIQAAALQFVRKVSGYRQPSRANEEVFNRAIDDISASTRRMLDSLSVK